MPHNDFTPLTNAFRQGSFQQGSQPGIFYDDNGLAYADQALTFRMRDFDQLGEGGPHQVAPPILAPSQVNPGGAQPAPWRGPGGAGAGAGTDVTRSPDGTLSGAPNQNTTPPTVTPGSDITQRTPFSGQYTGQPFIRPDELWTPALFGFDQNFSNLQQRTAIATGGNLGEEMFRGPEAAEFFKNNIIRSLINQGPEGTPDQTTLNAFSNVTPIESQFAEQVLGLSFEPNTPSFLQALNTKTLAPPPPPEVIDKPVVATGGSGGSGDFEQWKGFRRRWLMDSPGGEAGGEGGDGGGGGGGGGGSCFAKSTCVEMADGTTKEIQDIEIGDDTKGGRVTGVLMFEGNDDVYDYNGVTVAGSHAVFEDGEWMLVSDSKEGKRLNETVDTWYVHNTTDNEIFINGIRFSDYNQVAIDDPIDIAWWDVTLKAMNEREFNQQEAAYS